MSRNRLTKRKIFDELLEEVQRSQEATARFDHAVAGALGLNDTDMRCLGVVHREGGLTAGQLAAATGLSAGAMTTAIDRLERAGYVQRVRDEADRRRVLVQATPKAYKDASFYYGEHAAQAERLYNRYTQGELDLLLEFVRQGRVFNEAHAARVEAETSRTRG